MKKDVLPVTLTIIIIIASLCGCIENENNKKENVDKNEKNHHPEITLISPKGGESYTFGSNWMDIEILWNATDKDGDDMFEGVPAFNQRKIIDKSTLL